MINDKKNLCRGCHNDFYNQPGNSTTGECWHLQSATVVERTKIGVWQNPPYRWQPRQTLSCHMPDGERWIGPDDCRIAKEDRLAMAEKVMYGKRREYQDAADVCRRIERE